VQGVREKGRQEVRLGSRGSDDASGSSTSALLLLLLPSFATRPSSRSHFLSTPFISVSPPAFSLSYPIVSAEHPPSMGKRGDRMSAGVPSLPLHAFRARNFTTYARIVRAYPMNPRVLLIRAFVPDIDVCSVEFRLRDKITYGAKYLTFKQHQ